MYEDNYTIEATCIDQGNRISCYVHIKIRRDSTLNQHLTEELYKDTLNIIKRRGIIEISKYPEKDINNA